MFAYVEGRKYGIREIEGRSCPDTGLYELIAGTPRTPPFSFGPFALTNLLRAVCHHHTASFVFGLDLQRGLNKESGASKW